MKLVPQSKPELSWRCHACSRWNPPEKEDCQKCATVRPLAVEESNAKNQLIEMLRTCREYAKDKGLAETAISINTVSLALITETEGHLASLCRVFGQLHARYLQGRE